MIRSAMAIVAAWGVTLAAAGGPEIVQDDQTGVIRFQTDYLRLELTTDGKPRAFVDLKTGRDYCRPDGSGFALWGKGGKWVQCTSLKYADGKLILGFAGRATVTYEVRAFPGYLHFRVAALSDPKTDGLTVANIRTTMTKRLDFPLQRFCSEDFNACLLPYGPEMNASGQVADGKMILWANCRANLGRGLRGRGWAIIGAPDEALPGIIQEVEQASGLPHPVIDGQWAKASRAARTSYLFVDVTEKNVDKMISYARRAGVAYVQIYCTTWAKSYGAYPIHPDNYPHGEAGLKAVIDRLHAAGLRAGMHMMSGCINPWAQDPFVQPVADPGLASDGTFELAKDIDAQAKFIPTAKPPKEGFRKPWTKISGTDLRLGGEIIHYREMKNEPPYGFAGCLRGRHGSRATAHKQGEQAHHLIYRYGFLADPDTPLFQKLARRVGHVFNACGFDQIYFDGAEAMGEIGPHWYYVGKMERTIFEQLERDCLASGSGHSHMNWHTRARNHAIDFAALAVKQHLLHHKIGSRFDDYDRQISRTELGWTALLDWAPDHPATDLPEIEAHLVKGLAYDVPISLETRERSLDANGRTGKILDLVSRYEKLRLDGYFPPEIRKRLKSQQQDFTLQRKRGKFVFVPIVRTPAHLVKDRETERWRVNNPFAPQRPIIRMTARPTPRAYGEERNVVLLPFEQPAKAFAARWSSPGVKYAIKAAGEHAGRKCLEVTARSTLNEVSTDKTGLVRLTRPLAQPVDLSAHRPLAFWLEGDGKGEVLEIRIVSHPSGQSRRYVVRVDFEGWRYCELPKPAAAELFEVSANPVQGLYTCDLTRIKTVELRLYRLPAQGSVRLAMSPVEALEELREPLRDPLLTVGREQTQLQVTVWPDEYVELDDTGLWVRYDRNHHASERVKLEDKRLEFPAGEVPVKLVTRRGRAEVTMRFAGEPLK